MGLIVQTVETDLAYQVFYKSPQVELSKENNRLKLTSNILEAFELRLNDLKYNHELPSNNIIHFSRFFGRSLFDVSLGYEEYTARLRNPHDKDQAFVIYGKLAQLFESIPVSKQTVIIQQQLSTEGDATAYLKSLNPSCPAKFKEILQQTGVHYTLKIPSHELTIHITLAGSIFIEGGLYLSKTLNFSPNIYDFKKAFEVSVEYHDFILSELGLKMKDDI